MLVLVADEVLLLETVLLEVVCDDEVEEVVKVAEVVDDVVAVAVVDVIVREVVVFVDEDLVTDDVVDEDLVNDDVVVDVELEFEVLLVLVDTLLVDETVEVVLVVVELVELVDVTVDVEVDVALVKLVYVKVALAVDVVVDVRVLLFVVLVVLVWVKVVVVALHVSAGSWPFRSASPRRTPGGSIAWQRLVGSAQATARLTAMSARRRMTFTSYPHLNGARKPCDLHMLNQTLRHASYICSHLRHIQDRLQYMSAVRSGQNSQLPTSRQSGIWCRTY